MKTTHHIQTTQYLTISDLAKLLNVSKSTARNWADEGLIDTYLTDGNHRRFLKTDAQKLANNRELHNLELVGKMLYVDIIFLEMLPDGSFFPGGINDRPYHAEPIKENIYLEHGPDYLKHEQILRASKEDFALSLDAPNNQPHLDKREDPSPGVSIHHKDDDIQEEIYISLTAMSFDLRERKQGLIELDKKLKAWMTTNCLYQQGRFVNPDGRPYRYGII